MKDQIRLKGKGEPRGEGENLGVQVVPCTAGNFCLEREEGGEKCREAGGEDMASEGGTTEPQPAAADRSTNGFCELCIDLLLKTRKFFIIIKSSF